MTNNARAGAYRDFSPTPAIARWTVRPVDHSPSRVVRVEACACGRIVVVYGFEDDSIIRAIFLHNETPEHVAWRRRRRRDGEPAELIGGGA